MAKTAAVDRRPLQSMGQAALLENVDQVMRRAAEEGRVAQDYAGWFRFRAQFFNRDERRLLLAAGLDDERAFRWWRRWAITINYLRQRGTVAELEAAQQREATAARQLAERGPALESTIAQATAELEQLRGEAATSSNDLARRQHAEVGLRQRYDPLGPHEDHLLVAHLDEEEVPSYLERMLGC